MATMKLDKAGRNWLRKHGACDEGYKWAAYNCETMQEVFATAQPDWCIWVATRDGAMKDRDAWFFALWCAEQVRHLMTDKRSTDALDVRRRWLDGQATGEEMAAARAAAWAAARAAARDAAWAAARDAARAAAWAAAWDAARDAAWAAAWDAARAAAWDAARAAQAAWLRANVTLDFSA